MNEKWLKAGLMRNFRGLPRQEEGILRTQDLEIDIGVHPSKETIFKIANIFVMQGPGRDVITNGWA